MRTKRPFRTRLSAKDALYYLIKSHYLADDFPSTLTTDNFAEYCRSRYGTLPSTTDLLKRTTLFGVFSVPRTADTRRVLALPHPASQLALSRIIADNKKEIKDTIDDTKVSLYDTRARLGISRTFLGLDFDLKSTKEAQILSRYPVILKADIANFFHTIYTHSIPWGVLGKQHVKDVREGNDAAAKRKLESHWSSKIDVAVQRGNSRETFGIPVGPDTSRIICELLLCGVHRSPQLLGMINEHSAYRLVDDFYIGFDNEAKARECRDALRRTLWDYNLHLNETKTQILRSARVFDSGWKYDINNFVISDASAPKQYEDVERLLDIALRHCEDRGDWLPMVFFCYRILRLDIKPQSFNLIRDCMFRVGRDYTSCLDSVAQFAILHRAALVTAPARALIAEWARNILSVHARRGHDYETALILLICGIVGIQVDQGFMDLPERIVSPVVLAMLGLLRADNLLASPWDDWTEVPPGSGSVSSGRRWLPNYEAVLRGWTTNQDIIREITADAFFAPLLQQRVTFLNTADFLSSIDAAPEPGPFAAVARQTLRRIRPRRSSVVAFYG